MHNYVAMSMNRNFGCRLVFGLNRNRINKLSNVFRFDFVNGKIMPWVAIVTKIIRFICPQSLFNQYLYGFVLFLCVY